MKTHLLLLTAAVVIGGTICRSGDVVEVTDGEARDLLHRGRAKLATAGDADIVAASAGVTNGEAPLNADLAAHNEDREEQRQEAAQEAADAEAAAAAANAGAAKADAAAADQGGQGGKPGKRGK